MHNIIVEMFEEIMFQTINEDGDKFRGLMTKWPVQKQTDICNKPSSFIFYVLFFILFYNGFYLNNFSKKCLVTTLGTANEYHRCLNQLSVIANLLNIYWRRNKTNECIHSPFPGH